jgi:hypothetical protein
MIGLLAFLSTAAFAQEATEEPPPEPTQAALPTSAIPGDVLPVLINARTDLEILVNSQLGSERPLGWSGSLDINDPQLAILIRLDLELLVARLYGVDSRPEGWFGAVPSTAAAIARDIRHDLELLADFAVQPGVRPPGWAGDKPIMRCDRATQNLVQLLERSAQFVLTADPLSLDYCQQAATQASQFTESQLLGGVGGGTSGQPGGAGIAPAGSIRASGNATLAFLDRNARASVGVIPTTEAFLPLARSYAQFSNMILVRGNDFEVFVDYTTTTLSEAQFTALGDVNSFAANPVCLASWCKAEG